jgi:hypothetical protein
MTASITNTTALGGLGKVLISTIAALSKFFNADSAASNSGLAALRSASASSEIALASVAFLLTYSASNDTTFSFSLATFLSAFTLSRATLRSSFFFYNNGYSSANLTFNSAILLLVSFNFFKPVANLFLFIIYSALF